MSARFKTESAMVALLKDYYSGNVYAGTRGEGTEHPCVVVIAGDGEEIPLGVGNTMLPVMVSIQDSIDDAANPNSKARFDAACTAIVDALRYDDLATQLSAKASGFHCIGVQDRRGPRTEIDDAENLIAEIYEITLYVAEADL